MHESSMLHLLLQQQPAMLFQLVLAVAPLSCDVSGLLTWALALSDEMCVRWHP
jgi:hypothetical protein